MAAITRYKELRYEHRGDHWRLIDAMDGTGATTGIGPHYKSKAELLADLDRYASEYGCDGARPANKADRLAVAYSYALDRMAETELLWEYVPHEKDFARTCSPDEPGDCVICQGRALLKELGYPI